MVREAGGRFTQTPTLRWAKVPPCVCLCPCGCPVVLTPDLSLIFSQQGCPGQRAGATPCGPSEACARYDHVAQPKEREHQVPPRRIQQSHTELGWVRKSQTSAG